MLPALGQLRLVPHAEPTGTLEDRLPMSGNRRRQAAKEAETARKRLEKTKETRARAEEQQSRLRAEANAIRPLRMDRTRYWAYVHKEAADKREKEACDVAKEASKYAKGVALLIIDPQVDFHEHSRFGICDVEGSLAVSGANDDSIRISKLLRKHADHIDSIVVTLDTHTKKHIGHSGFWRDDAGEHPPPWTQISANEIAVDDYDFDETKKWMACKPENQAWARVYAQMLKASNKGFDIMVWPEHCIKGTAGQLISPLLQSDLNAWADSSNRREKQDGEVYPRYKEIEKGMEDKTEMYSIFKAEVPVEEEATHFNVDLVKWLAGHKQVLVCGQAKSHCVNFSLSHLLSVWPPERAKDLVLLSDGTSPVAKFESVADDFEQAMSHADVTVIKCEKYMPTLQAAADVK